jgi:hypothetical protein
LPCRAVRARAAIQADFRGPLSAANDVRCLPFWVAQTNPQLAQRKYWTPGDRSVRGKAYTGSWRQHSGQGVASTTGTDCVAPRSGMSPLVGERDHATAGEVGQSVARLTVLGWSDRAGGTLGAAIRSAIGRRRSARASNAPFSSSSYAMRQQTGHAPGRVPMPLTHRSVT